MRNAAAEEGRRWLAQAKEDLKWAEYLAEAGGYHIVCFLAQQIAEKALKAFLYTQGREIVLGHSIGRLCGDAAEFDDEFKSKAKRWTILDTYYIPTRYPNGLPDGIPADVYTQEIALSALSLARDVVESVGGLIEAVK